MLGILCVFFFTQDAAVHRENVKQKISARFGPWNEGPYRGGIRVTRDLARRERG